MLNFNDLSFIRKEILIKENERFRLKEIGLISDLNGDFELLCRKCDDLVCDNIETYKRELLMRFYRLLDFEGFVKRNYNSVEIIQMNRMLMRKALVKLQNDFKGNSIDNMLRMTDNTIAFFMSRHLFEQMYPLFLSGKISLTTPYGLFVACRNFVESRFPTDFNTYFSQLKCNDKEIWDKTYYFTRRQMYAVTKGHLSSLFDRKDVVDSITSDTFLMMVDKIMVENSLDFNDVTAFKSYVYRTGYNKMMEFFRKDKKSGFIDCVEHIENLSLEEDSQCDDEEVPDFMDVDIDNDYEVANAISIILCDENQPLRSRLIGDDTERVELFMMRYVHGKDYDEIIEMKYGKVGKEEKQKLYDSVRQNMVRVKGRLVSKFKNIIKDEREM